MGFHLRVMTESGRYRLTENNGEKNRDPCSRSRDISVQIFNKFSIVSVVKLATLSGKSPNYFSTVKFSNFNIIFT